MPSPFDALDAVVQRRLNEEEIVWFTSISPSNRPASNPVWFLWDGDDIVVFSQPTSFRVRNLRLNPHVVLTLQGVDGAGNNVVIISGEAGLRPGNQIIPEAYWKKYKHLLSDMSPEEMTNSYNVEIRIKPTKIRTE